MPRKEHPADRYKREQIAKAQSFAVHFSKGPLERFTRPAGSMEEAKAIAEELNQEHGQFGRRACIYAITAEGVSIPTGESYSPRRGQG